MRFPREEVLAVATEHGTRRWFLRLLTSTGLAAVTIGAQALLGSPAASAQARYLCCALTPPETLWCPMLCAEQKGMHIRCWTCNGVKCKCCECVAGNNCFARATCSYKVGCCYYDS